MKTRLLNLAFSVALFGCTNAYTQLTPHCPYTHHEQDLICLIPDVTQTGNTATLGGFNSTIAQVLGQLPLAVPNSGFVLGFDKGGTPVTLNDTLGSVLTERGNTIGRHKLFLGFTFQRFVFSTIDGNNLTNLPVFFCLRVNSRMPTFWWFPMPWGRVHLYQKWPCEISGPTT